MNLRFLDKSASFYLHHKRRRRLLRSVTRDRSEEESRHRRLHHSFTLFSRMTPEGEEVGVSTSKEPTTATTTNAGIMQGFFQTTFLAWLASVC